MNKPHILLDMDGVIADFHGTLIEVYNKDESNSPKVQLEQCTNFEFSKCLSKDIHARMLAIYMAPGFFSGIRPFSEAKSVVNELMTFTELEICSAPTKIFNEETQKKQINAQCAFEKINWIHQHFSELSRSISLTINKYNYRADGLIDDALHNHAKWCKAHPNGVGYLIDRPWNQTKRLPRNCVRTTLIEVPALVKEHFQVKD